MASEESGEDAIRGAGGGGAEQQQPRQQQVGGGGVGRGAIEWRHQARHRPPARPRLRAHLRAARVGGGGVVLAVGRVRPTRFARAKRGGGRTPRSWWCRSRRLLQRVLLLFISSRVTVILQYMISEQNINFLHRQIEMATEYANGPDFRGI